MATPEECRVAIGQLAARLAGPGDKRAEGLDRSVSAAVTDLDIVFRGHLHDGVLDDVTTDEGPAAQIRLTLTSDDLVLIAGGELSLGSAFMSGRMKLHASLPDMLRLRTLI
ncbi:MAG TPA: SCP2 sterol-binding domain-containing protein [Acidothermaceae bacterium]